MSTTTNVVIGLSLLVLAGVALGGPELVAAQAVTGTDDLSNIHSVQQLSITNDGLYAPSLDSLVNADFGQGVTFRNGSQVAYMTNADRSHYLAATILPAGGVAVRGDEGSPAVCAEYTVECVARVTADADLLAATPHWITF